MTTLVPLFFIGPSSFLQVTRATIKAWMSLVSSGTNLRLWSIALERLENLHRLTMGDML